jgi:hypothetical protein
MAQLACDSKKPGSRLSGAPLKKRCTASGTRYQPYAQSLCGAQEMSESQISNAVYPLHAQRGDQATYYKL